jgi:hypothetical protein
VVLDGPDDVEVGVQVKRTKNKIKLGQIHQFYGALVENGLTRGLFVATSDFQPGAVRSARAFTQLHGRPIELIDAEKFYDALKIAQRKRYETIWDTEAPFLLANYLLLEQSSHPLFDMQYGKQMSEHRRDGIGRWRRNDLF